MTHQNNWLELYKALPSKIFESEDLYQKIGHKIKVGTLSKEQDPLIHHVVYFLPFNPVTQEVFLVFDHRVGGLWLTPGGHVKTGESPLESLSREVFEELGIKIDIPKFPFFVSQTIPTNPARPCLLHYDFWYLLTTNGSDFSLELKEHSRPQWLKLSEAKKLVTDPATLHALDRLSGS